MTKIKLKITHIVDMVETNSYVIGIKENNKISYLDDKNLITIEKIGDSLKIKRINEIENNMLFGEESLGYFVIDNKKIEYKIKTNKLLIKENRIEIDYTIESKNKYILEVLDDWDIKTSN